MDRTYTHHDDPNNVDVDLLDSHNTREAVNDLCSMPRPPPTGEDSSESDRTKEGLVHSSKLESYECPSPRLTPRRCTSKELPAMCCGVTHEEDKLAPLGFEPEGEAVSTPTFNESTSSCFTELLNHSEGSFVFYQYLRRVNGHILMDFCRACEHFREMVPTAPQTLSTAKTIFQQYILTRETCEQLGVKANTRSKIAELVSIQPVDPLLFEEAYTQVVSNMKNLHYKSFLNSNFYKEFTATQCESKIVNDGYNRRFQGGYLPTLPEEKVLGFADDEVEEFEFEQHCKSGKGLYLGSNMSTSDEKNARKLLHVPIKDVSSPYYYPAAPLASITESGSISSEALTDDTLSMTTDTSDGTRHSGSRRAHRSSKSAHRYPFVPRTHRMPKEAKHPMNPDEFAKILTEKLQKVLVDQQMQEREATNLSQSLEIDRSSSSLSKKSILQEAIENKERRDRIPLSTMIPLPVQDDTSSISTSNHSSSKSTSARATAGSGGQNSSSSESNHKRSRNMRQGYKSSKHESEPANKPTEQLQPTMYKEPKMIKETNNIPHGEIPFLTVNHHRIQEWMATGEEELRKQQRVKSHQSKSRQSSGSSSRVDGYTAHHQPMQPIAQDPMMPLLQGPEATTVLGEVKRRLIIETKEQERKTKHSQRHRSRNSLEDSSDQSSYCGKESSTDSQSLLSYDLNQHQSYSSLPSSASNMGNDTKSRSDSGIGEGVKKKEKHNATTVIYYMWGEPIAYRTSLPGKRITLGQFKTQLIPRKGKFRYFFKTKTDDHDCSLVYEDVRDDEDVLPLFEGKIVGKVEKVE